LAQVQLEREAVEIPLLKQFSAVIVEDSSTVTLPAELAEIWRGCGGSEGTSEAAVKLFVRWDVLTGGLMGPELTDARTNDHQSPLPLEQLPAGSLYLADLGFFGLQRLQQIARGRQGKRFFVTRWQPRTTLYNRRGHRHDLAGLLPQQVGQVRELGVILGKREGLPVRLILVRVPEKVAKERQQRIRQAAQNHGRSPSEEVLYLANWTIVLTNVPCKRASFSQVLVLLRLRWQIERLFRLWKEAGQIDEWRSQKPYRILCEFYGKICAMIIQQALLQEGCWADPYRSLVKAARSLRREANRLMMAFIEGTIAQTVPSLLRSLRAGCQTEHRAAHPSTAQLLLDGLDWELELLLT